MEGDRLLQNRATKHKSSYSYAEIVCFLAQIGRISTNLITGNIKGSLNPIGDSLDAVRLEGF